MKRRPSTRTGAATDGLSRRTFLLAGAAVGVGLGVELTMSTPPAAAAQPTGSTTITANERPHRTLLGVL